MMRPYQFTITQGNDEPDAHQTERAGFATLAEARAFVLGLVYAAGWYNVTITEASRPVLEDAVIPGLPYRIDEDQ